MKIALISVAPPYRGGISLNSAILFRHLEARHQVIFYNFSRQYPDFLFPGKTQFETGTPAVPVSTERTLDSINPITWRTTAKKIIRQSPNLLIIRFWNPFFAPLSGYIANYVKRRLPNIHIMAICDNIIPHERHWFDVPFIRYFFKKVDSFLVLSSSVESDLKLLVANPRFKKIYHPIYHVFGKPVSAVEARKKLGLTQKHIILYFGYVRSYKGLDTLIIATRKLKTLLNDFQVIAVGESYEGVEKYENLIRANDVQDVLKWENQYIPDDRVKLYFSAADVISLPYHSATQSGIVPIAFHFNKPVVVTRVGGLPEVINEGKSGFIINPGDSEALAHTLADGLKNRSFEKMIPHVIEEKKRFTWESMVTAIEELVVES
ncbi:MAG: glycosyltransferase [Fidelibacterota bacterium]